MAKKTITLRKRRRTTIKGWTKKQVEFAVSCILEGCLDMIEGGLPSADLGEKNPYKKKKKKECRLAVYNRGNLEAAGEALSIFFAQLTGEGMGCYDALMVAGDFAGAMDLLVTSSWADDGKAVRKAIMAKTGGFRMEDVYPNWPDIKNHARLFADEMFK